MSKMRGVAQVPGTSDTLFMGKNGFTGKYTWDILAI